MLIKNGALILKKLPNILSGMVTKDEGKRFSSLKLALLLNA
jgi:hypothetical protein